jgi:glycogen phosphorylase
MFFSKTDKIIRKIKHFLVTETGKVLEEASNEEYYTAFCMALREEIMIHWTAHLHTIEQTKAKIAYYMSLEYLPGRLTESTITNIHAVQIVKEVLEKTGRSYWDIMHIETDPGLGNGGLGRLSSCVLESAASKQYPVMGYGLRYQYGIFEQELWNGSQTERPDDWLLYDNPWEIRRDLESTFIHFAGQSQEAKNRHGDLVERLENYEEVRALPYDIPIVGYPQNDHFSVVSLRLWSTKESPRNFELQRYNAGQLGLAAENTSLTDVLYPNDHHDIGKKTRLKQEFLLASASIQDIIRRHLRIHQKIELLPDKVSIQINDTHPALVVAELTRVLTKHYDLSFARAFEITQSCCNYTNHTTLKEALEEWNEDRMHQLLPRQYHIIQTLHEMLQKKIDQSSLPDKQKIKEATDIIQNNQVHMARLCLFACHKVNGVAKLHGDILKERIFPEFNALYPEKITYVTNGVTQRRWLLHTNPMLAHFITERIGDGWLRDFAQIEKLQEFAHDADTQRRFLQIKAECKKRLIDFIHKENPIRGPYGVPVGSYELFSEKALFDVQVKRIHEYKRHLMNIIHAIMIFFELKKDPKAKTVQRQILLGGKASPGYDMAKRIIRLAFAVGRTFAKDPEVSSKLRLLFFENYNVSRAEMIIPAADLSQQISTAGMEASGTGNMKLSMNGALTIGTEDGANIEMQASVTEQWWPFSFGANEEELVRLRDSYDPKRIYESNPQIKEALDALRDGFFAENEGEHQAFHTIYQSLVEGLYTDRADRFFILHDLQSYQETQKKVEELFAMPEKWAETAIHNMAKMGPFSIDCAVANYAKDIWEISPCPTDMAILEKVKREYSEHLLFHD